MRAFAIFASLLSVAVSAANDAQASLRGMMMTMKSGECSKDFCSVDRDDYPNMLPMGNVNVMAYSFDNAGRWYIAGTDSDGKTRLWRTSCDLSSYEVLAEHSITDMQANPDGSEVYAISEKRVIVINTQVYNSIRVIANANSALDYTGLTYVPEDNRIYVTANKFNAVFGFERIPYGTGFKTLGWVAGSQVKLPDNEFIKGIPYDSPQGLNSPTSIRYLAPYMYIRVDTGVTAWLPFSYQASSMYVNLGIPGNEGFTITPDNYLYYRHGQDAVYRKPLNDPTANGELYAGGCGCGMGDNQICTASKGNLVNFTPDNNQIVMQDYNSQVNFRFLGWCQCPSVTTGSPVTTTLGTTTEAAETTTTEAVTTEPVETTTTEAVTTEPVETTTTEAVTTEAPETTTTEAVTTEAPETTTTEAVTTEAPETTTESSLTCDAYCSSISAGSYCKYWETPSTCFGNGSPCSCGASTTEGPVETTTTSPSTEPETTTKPSDVTTTEASTTESVVSTTTESSDSTTEATGYCASGNAYCDSVWSGTYCKYWQTPSLCSETDLPCSCDEDFTTTKSSHTTEYPTTSGSSQISTTTESGLQCDNFCNSIEAGSYCKSWQTPSVCSGTTIACSC